MLTNMKLFKYKKITKSLTKAKTEMNKYKKN